MKKKLLKISYYAALAMAGLLYIAGEFYGFTVCVAPIIVAGALWGIAGLTPEEEKSEGWKNSRWFW